MTMMVLLFSACREPFEVEYEIQDTSLILVVSGYINAGATESHYELNYAQPFGAENSEYISVGNALITIESERGERYNANSSVTGRYVIRHPVLDPDQQYRLRIQMGELEYLSKFVTVRISPEIGEMEWERLEDGLHIYLNTADASNNTYYYRWEYEETWRYFSQYRNLFIADGGRLRYREPHEFNHSCYTSDHSSNIYLGSSEGLSNDAIHRFPIMFIPNLSEKLSDRYSILVRQLPLTKEGYRYWEQLKKSSQDLGDIFGPMPSELKGNIACISHPDLHVIGIVEAVKPAEKRIYINRNDMPDFWPVDNNVFNCILIEETVSADFLINRPNFYAVDLIEGRGYTYVDSRRCVDCALRGGTYDPPPFWKMK